MGSLMPGQGQQGGSGGGGPIGGAISGGTEGASMGSMAGPWGAAIGGVLGTAMGLLGGMHKGGGGTPPPLNFSHGQAAPPMISGTPSAISSDQGQGQNPQSIADILKRLHGGQ